MYKDRTQNFVPEIHQEYLIGLQPYIIHPSSVPPDTS